MGRRRTVLRLALLAALSACGSRPPAASPSPPPFTAASAAPLAPVASKEAATSPPPLVPISLERFDDGARHYRNANGVTEYPRYLPEQYVGIAENILLCQRDNGGWRENWDPARILNESEKRAALADRPKADTSFDNRTSYTHTEYLAEVYARTRDERFRAACLRGLDFVLGAQHSSGGFPHSFPDTSGYRGNVTLMDDVTPGALGMLRRAGSGTGAFAWLDDARRERARRAVERGTAGLLKMQVRVRGQLTAWAGQYDPATLEPTSARAFELPSLVSSESATVVRYLMDIENPPHEVIASIEAAAKWFDRVKLEAMRVETVPAEVVRYKHHTSADDRRVVYDAKAPPIWARFYEIATNRPFMANRDGKKVYALSEVERERRTGYRWYGYFGRALLEKDYPAWRERNGFVEAGQNGAVPVSGPR
ncbi:MAG TPA: pectate lyase [Polyangiaceae bacterium]